MAVGLGLVHEVLHAEGLAKLGDGLAALEHVRPGELEEVVRNPDTRGTPVHPHVVLAGHFSSRSLPVELPTSHGL